MANDGGEAIGAIWTCFCSVGAAVVVIALAIAARLWFYRLAVSSEGDMQSRTTSTCAWYIK